MSETTIFIIVGLIALILAIVVFDVFIIKKKGKQASISAYIIRGSKKYPAFFIPFSALFGFVCGHLFWSMDTFDWATKETIIKKCREYKGNE